MDTKVKSGELTATTPGQGPFAFGEYRLDPARRLLSLRGQPIEITGKPFDALVLLVQRAGNVVSRRDLTDALWPSTIVEDNNLSQAVLALRRALDDVHDVPRFIATVPRRGYQFIAKVQHLPGATSRRAARRNALLGTALLLLIAIGGVTWLAHETSYAEATACSTSPSLEASSWCRQALDLYATHGGIGVGVPTEPREQILQRLDQALELDPRFPEALGWRAHFHLDALMFDPLPAADWQRVRNERMLRVERDATSALKLDPWQQMAQVTLARLDLYRWLPTEALARLEAVRRKHPQSAVVEHYIAIAGILTGDYSRAVAASQRALDLDPRNAAPYSPLVLALLNQGEHERALSAARGMIERAPNAPLGYINLARALSARSDPLAVLEATRLAEQRLVEPALNLHLDAALLYARAGEQLSARRLVGRFNQTSTNWHVDSGVAALASLAMQDHEGARQHVIRALEERGSGADPMPLFHIRLNSWKDPKLEEEDWHELRRKLAFDESSRE